MIDNDKIQTLVDFTYEIQTILPNTATSVEVKIWNHACRTGLDIQYRLYISDVINEEVHDIDRLIEFLPKVLELAKVKADLQESLKN